MERNSKCSWCGCQIVPNIRGPQKLWCSRNCRYLAGRQKRIAILRNCNVCGLQFVYGNKKLFCSPQCSKVGGQIRSRAYQRMMSALVEKPLTRMKKCGWCNTDMEVPFSYTGTRAYHEPCRAEALRRRNKNKSDKRQSAKTDVQIRFHEIAKRDLGVCHICQKEVDLSLPRTSKMGGTLDHVIPISKGGLDLVENLRLAHWICNIRKSDSLEFLNG